MICVTSYLKFMVSPGEAIGQTQKIIRSESRKQMDQIKLERVSEESANIRL